jgi:hypothetical protein
MEDVGIFCGHLEKFLVIWYIFSRFGILYQEKSGNPALQSNKTDPKLWLPRIAAAIVVQDRAGIQWRIGAVAKQRGREHSGQTRSSWRNAPGSHSDRKSLVENSPKICPKFAQNFPKICPKFAQNLPKMLANPFF